MIVLVALNDICQHFSSVHIWLLALNWSLELLFGTLGAFRKQQ